jgi:acyl transferase domain-containing protein/acyl carrier protein
MSTPLEEYRSRLREALSVINELKARLDLAEQSGNEPIAIIGLGCRFPGGSDGPEAFWRALEHGTDAVREIPPERWPREAIPGNKPEVRWAGLIDHVDEFDASFFGISPREAESLDPQQRLLLEVAWDALEDAGQRPDQLAGSSTGVFVGMCAVDYVQRILERGPTQFDAYCATGNLFSTAAGRLAYVLGLQGPCMAIDTACSSSLVAISLACQSLRAGECDLAMAGGVNLILAPLNMAMLAETQALSPDGRCKTLDARANGFVRGEGCGVVVLKRLSDALRDGDRVHALIRGWAVNQDGRSAGLTAPNVLAQQAMLRRALERARVSPEEIGYVELHGTGTSLGDPIEADALREVLGQPRRDGSSCALGAVKTNIGHLEGAAGVAGLIKVVLSLEHQAIPRNLHFRKLNPRISLEGTPFVIPTETLPWKRGARRRLAGVSSFGLSGTNAHVILEEAPQRASEVRPREQASAHLVPLSAKSPQALLALARAYHGHIAREDGEPLEDVAYTASVRRTHHAHRLAVVGRSRQEVTTALEAFVRDGAAPNIVRGQAPIAGRSRVVFVFPGQGSQWQGMGRQLLAEEPAFRAAIELCDQAIRREAGFSVLEELAADGARSRLDEIDVVQPVLFAMAVALAALWRSWGVTPDHVVGHSMGEVAAAHVAGILDIEDAAKVICRRSRLLRRIAGKGAMGQVELSLEEARSAVAGYEGRLSVGVSNGARSTVLSGEREALEEVLSALEKRGVFCRRVKVDVASHSPQVDVLREDLRAALRDVRPGRGRLSMQSTVTGSVVSGPELVGEYWARNLRDPVLFGPVVRALIEQGCGLFVEMSPHPILQVPVDGTLRELGRPGVATGSLRRGEPERASMLLALGMLYAHGLDADFRVLFANGGRCVPLPPYPWQRQRYWIESRPIAARAQTSTDALDGCAYTVAWRSDDTPAATVTQPRQPSTWLILADTGGTGVALAASLRARGDRCVVAVASREREDLGPDVRCIDPAKFEDYRALLDEALQGSGRLRGVVHLFGLDAASRDAMGVETLKDDQRLGSLSVLHLLRAILGRALRDAPLLALVTRGVHAVGQQGTLTASISQAPLWGLGKTISLEHSAPACRCIDLDPSSSADAEEVDALARELTLDDGEEWVAHRGGTRFLARLSRSHLDAVLPSVPLLRPDASYLITGGLGGLGLSLARWMVEQGARHLVLVGRREPSEEAVSTVRQLEEAGAKVLVVAADVAHPDEVHRLIVTIDERCPPLRGVVHAAGVIEEPQMLLELSEERLWRMLAPKMFGAWNLHMRTLDRALDFFVCYSSASSILGLVGQGAYAAANAFLDALSRARAATGRPATSIQWGAFAEAGMLARADGGKRSSLHAGMASLSPSEGVQALARLLLHPRAEVAIARLDVRRWLDVFPQMAGSPFWSELRGEMGRASEAPSALPRLRSELDSARPEQRLQLLEERVREQVGQALHLPPAAIERDVPFKSLGVDSLMSLEVRNRLEASLGLRLPATLLFIYPTVAALAAHLLEALGSSDPGPAPREAPTEPADAPAPERPPEDLEALLEAKLASLERYLQ